MAIKQKRGLIASWNDINGSVILLKQPNILWYSMFVLVALFLLLSSISSLWLKAHICCPVAIFFILLALGINWGHLLI